MAIDGPVRRQKVLVVDDDRRVRELLEVALDAHGFTVITATDGDDALRRAGSDQPDLVVLDVRLPRRSGLEVCDALRGDANHASLPVILVSAVGDTDARLQAFSRGADDFLPKPFSPKELIARIKRLLERSSEARRAERRAQELERELKMARETTQRAHLESRHERDLRELSMRAGRELHGVLDLDALAASALEAIQTRIGTTVVALLAPEKPAGPLVARAVRGDGFERIAGLELPCDGELSRFLAGLGRPAPRRELERLAELREDLAPFIARAFALLAPVRSVAGLEGLLVADERPDGHPFTRADAECVSAYADALSVALPNAQRLRHQMDAWLETLGDRAMASRGVQALVTEACELVERVARVLALQPRSRELLRHGVALTHAEEPEREMLSRMCAHDPTGRLSELAEMIERVSLPGIGVEDRREDRRADQLLRAAWRYVEARSQGMTADRAVACAVERLSAEGFGQWGARASTTHLQRTLFDALSSAVREADHEGTQAKGARL